MTDWRESSRPSPRPHNWKPQGTRQRRGYGADHQRLRRAILSVEPYCRVCKQAGRKAKSTEVDHVIPKCRGENTEWQNLQGICADCHWRKTGREGASMRWECCRVREANGDRTDT